MKPRKKTHALAAAALGALAALPATAAFADTASEIRALKAQLRRLEAKVAEQHRDASHATNVANHAAPRGEQGHAAPPVFVSFKNGLFVETEDHAYSFKVGGRIAIDGGGISQPLNGFSNQAGFRQARLEVEGKAAKIWFYKLQYDFAGTGQNAGNNQTLGGVRDFYFGLQHPALTLPFTKDPIILQVGSMFEPFSLEQINSTKYRDFIERGMAVEAIAPNRHLGAAIGAHGDDWTAKGGVYTTSFEDVSLNPARNTPARFGVPAGAGFVPTGGGQYFDLTGRLTYAPIHNEHDLFHIGLSGRYHRPNDATGASDDRVLNLGNRLRSEATLLGQGLLGTPDLSCGSVAVPVGLSAAFLRTSAAGHCVSNVFAYGFELAASHGPFSVQAEYLGQQVNRNTDKILTARAAGGFAPGGSSHHFGGYYVQGQWWITGEERASAYDVKDKSGASFGQVKILSPLSAGGLGAIGLAARYSSINLNSGPFQGSNLYNLLALNTFVAPNPAAAGYIANAGVVGGRQENVTAGVNWYPDNGIHIQANWTRVMRVSAPLNGNAAQGAFINGAHPNLFEVRTQVYW